MIIQIIDGIMTLIIFLLLIRLIHISNKEIKKIKEEQITKQKQIDYNEKRINYILKEMIDRNDIKHHVIFGLMIDGAHHKQYHLEQIASLLKLDLSKTNYEKGIPN